MKSLPTFLVPAAALSCAFAARADMGGTGWVINDRSIYSTHEYSLLSPWRDSALWNQPQGAKQNVVSRHDFTQALAQQVPILGLVGGWRDTFRGTGALARREFKFGGSSAKKSDGIMLSIGTQTLPSYQFLGLNGNATGAGLKWGRFSIGSTAMRSAFQSFADTYDNATEGEKKPIAQDESSYTWMTAQALNDSHGTIDLVMMRVRRDLTPSQLDKKKMAQGSSMGMRADLKLWADWKMRGEWMNNRLEKGDAANAWHLEMNGPLKNPLGVTQINFWLDARQPGFAAMNDMRPSDGYSNQRFSMQQNVKLGDMSTALQWTQIKNENMAQTLYNGNQRRFASREAKADMTWKLSPKMSLGANYSNFDSNDSTMSGANLNDNGNARREARANLKWQLSPAISANFNYLNSGNQQTTKGGNFEYSNFSARSEARADMNWKLSKTISMTAGYSMLDTGLRVANGTHINTDDNTRDEGKIGLSWKFSPKLSMVANVANLDSVRDTTDSNSGDALNSTVIKRQEVGAGLQWQMSRTLAVSATMARVGTNNDFFAGGIANSLAVSRQTDQQMALGLSQKTKAGSWNLQFTQHNIDDAVESSTQKHGDSLQLQSERQLLPNLRLKGSWTLASDKDISNRLSSDQATHNVEAQWGLSDRSNLSLNYSDWNTARQQIGRSDYTGSSKFGLNFNWGSAVKGNGLGLAFQYSQSDVPSVYGRDYYKIGLTYK